MKKTFAEKSLHVPSKREMLFGIFCWFMFEFGFSLTLPLFFDHQTYQGAYFSQIVYMVGCFLLTFIVFFRFLKNARHYAFPSELLKTVLIGFGIYLILTFVVEWIVMDIALLRHFFFEETTIIYNPNQEGIDTMVNYSPIPMHIGVVLLAPITEECLVRGMIFGPLCRKKPWLAYVVSTLLFSGLHVLPFAAQLDMLNVIMLLLIYIPSGIVLGWTYQRTRCIYGPIAMHCFMNLYASVMSYL